MDLYDILIAKKLAGGGGGGGGGNAETATIVITVTNGTATFTSGEFPDWCTSANSDYIYGKAFIEVSAYGENETTPFWLIAAEEGNEFVVFANYNYQLVMTKDLSTILYGGDEPSPIMGNGTITITLIYMPN